MKKISLIITAKLLAISLFSCDTGSETIESQNFQPDTLVILNYFNETQFENDTLVDLLNEIGICNNSRSDSSKLAACSPRNYKFFKYNQGMTWHEGFGLEIRATVDDFPLRRFILFERVNGILAKSRGFVANLAEMHTSKSGFNDLRLLFPDREAGSFVVKFIYYMEEKNYVYHSLQAIDGYPVKAEKQDSLSAVVLERLTNNNMFF
jgi:hypothetical protein